MTRTVLTRELRAAFHVRTGSPIVWPAARALLSMLVPLAVLLQLDRLDLVAGAVFGALTSVYCRSEPFRQQARSLAVIAVAMVLSVLAGDLLAAFLGDHPWHEPLALLATAVVGAVTTALATAVRIGAPGGLIFAFATGACAHLTLAPAGVSPHVLVTAASATFAWLVSILGSSLGGLAPHRRVVADALDATAEHLLRRPDLTTRHRAAVAVESAWHSVALVGARHRDTPGHLDLVRATQACERLLIDRTAPETTPEYVRSAAATVRSGQPFPAREAGSPPASPGTPASRWRVIRTVLRAATRPRTHADGWLVTYAVRVGLAALVAGAAAHALGIGHAYWAAVSAVSVLQATSTSRSVPRMLQRVSGTVLGVLIGLAVLSAHPAAWVVLLLLALFQWAAEMTVAANYAFGLMFATPVALLVSSLAGPAAPSELASNRLWATVLGAVVAVGAAWALPNRSWVHRVDRALARVRRLSDVEPWQPAALRPALVELHEAYDTAAGEVERKKLPTEELLDVSHRAYALLDRPRSPIS